MDAVIFISICLVIVVTGLRNEDSNESALSEIKKEDTTRVAKLNDSFFDDEEAFMDIAHALGFPPGGQ